MKKDCFFYLCLFAFITLLSPLCIMAQPGPVKGKVVSVAKKLATIAASLIDGEGTVCATAEIIYFCLPENIARAKYHYPGIEAFYHKPN